MINSLADIKRALVVPGTIIRKIAIDPQVRKDLVRKGYLRRCPSPNSDCYDLTEKGCENV